MKRIMLIFCTAFLFAACNNDNTSAESKVAGATETKDSSEAWIPVDSATAEKAWMEYMTPGDAHKMLARSDGQWTGEMKMWMAPGAPPMTSTTTSTNKMIFGGRYQQINYKGDFNGMPFEGMNTTAYDNAKKVFISTWIDNMGTGLMTMEGTWDSTSKTISYKGKMICPANGKECDVRESYRIIDDNTHLMEMWGPDMQTGKEFKNMEIRFTRKK